MFLVVAFQGDSMSSAFKGLASKNWENLLFCLLLIEKINSSDIYKKALWN